MAPEANGRGPLALIIAGIVMTVVGWLAFTVAIFVIVGEGEDGNTTLQNIGALVAVVGALVGSVGPFLITGGALWWALRGRSGPRSDGPTWRSGGIDISG